MKQSDPASILSIHLTTMRHQEIQHLINDIRYLEGWELYLISINFEYAYMYWGFRDVEGRQECRKWLITLRTATPSDILQTALRAAIDAQEHEVREQFRFKGKKIYGPHFDPEALVDFAGQRKNLSLKDG